MGRFDAMNLFGWIAGYAFGIGVGALLPGHDLGLVFVGGAVVLAVGLAVASRLVRGIRHASRSASFSVREVVRSAFRGNVLVVTLPWMAIYAFIGTALIFLLPAATGVGVAPGYFALAIATAGGLFDHHATVLRTPRGPAGAHDDDDGGRGRLRARDALRRPAHRVPGAAPGRLFSSVSGRACFWR